jgi:prepilin-type N-terminal cleavage/methylation domain-containing protein
LTSAPIGSYRLLIYEIGLNGASDGKAEAVKSRFKNKRRPWPSKAGFSLLEVLASLVVTSLLIMALTPFVTMMLATWSRGSEVASMVELQMRGLGVLRDDLSYAIVWRGFGRPEDFLAFRGSETSMSFPAASGLGDGRDGLEMISIDVTNSANGRALIRRRAAVIGTTRTAFADPVILFSGPYKYFLRYYSQDGDEMSAWADPYSLPARVVLNIVDEGNRLSVYSIQLPLVASISSACLANANLPNCPIQPQPSQADDAMLSNAGQPNQ